jgi:hypothetical protein
MKINSSNRKSAQYHERHEKNYDFHEKFTPNTILDNSVILKKVQKQKPMVYLGRMLHWQR